MRELTLCNPCTQVLARAKCSTLEDLKQLRLCPRDRKLIELSRYDQDYGKRSLERNREFVEK